MRKHAPEDLQLTLIIVVATLAVLVITPYAVFRFLEGNILVGSADAAMALVSLLVAGYTYHSGKTQPAGTILSVFLSLGVTVVATNIPVYGILWIYPLIMFVFYLCNPWLSFAMILLVKSTVLAFGLLNSEAQIFQSTLQMTSFLSSGLTATIFSFLFATRNNRHRAILMNWANKDPLTGLENRRKLEIILNQYADIPETRNSHTGLIIIDLDDFKEVNDLFGHAAGDRILVQFSDLLLSSIRHSDTAFRYGGDEFIVLVPGTSPDGLRTVCDNLISGIRGNLHTEGRSVSISIGASTLDGHQNSDHWFAAADHCLYQAKAAGKNRYVIYDSSSAKLRSTSER
ncbi:GGDEF domain-containing protein [Spirochaeta dissipatitropha]